ncbi:hypothetical protein [Staphylococcus hominis]|uniref:hypothetical protein n=1 Tax=Staphylococcus hominis TaxID=1290 RepID=UPI0021CCCFC0|nr:hypothetical protein [Staphylococcus hominis]
MNRNNVLKRINDSGSDTSLVIFQGAICNVSNGTWSMVAITKSGAGVTYKINVISTGYVTRYEVIDDKVVIDDDISLNYLSKS